MADFNIRTDAVDVEQIMRQIRARIREKRGVDYTEEQIQELASVKLEKFLDPKGVRSDLVEQFRRQRSGGPPPPTYAFEENTLFDSSRAPVRFIRRMLKPILKLFFNPTTLTDVLHRQATINQIYLQRTDNRDELDALYYEVIHNLVLETTRLGIEVKNLKMRVESLSSRLDFDERRARALEGVVQYRPSGAISRDRGRPQSSLQPAAAAGPQAVPGQPSAGPVDTEHPENQPARRRRRRRRGRRGRGGTPAVTNGGATQPGSAEARPFENGEVAASQAEPDDSTPDPEPDGPDGGPFSTDQ
ncbi:MAG TPA: hypothetical protein VH702_03960 [Vicinamibacterales bacterium]|jgi:hypothetical protein